MCLAGVADSVGRHAAAPYCPSPYAPVLTCPALPCRRFVVNRRHAQLYVEDGEVDARFARECYVRKDIVNWTRRPGWVGG